MRQHLSIVAVLNALLSLASLVIGFIVLTTSMAAGAMVGLSGSVGVGLLAGTVGSVIGAVLIVLALPGIALAWGIHTQRAWARPLGFVLGAIHLLNFPFGTAVGGYTIWVLLQPESEALLSGRDPVR